MCVIAVTFAIVGIHTHTHTCTHTHIHTHIHRVVTIFEVGKLTDESLGSLLQSWTRYASVTVNTLWVFYEL